MKNGIFPLVPHPIVLMLGPSGTYAWDWLIFSELGSTEVCYMNKLNTHPFVDGVWVRETEWGEQGRQFEFKSSVPNIDSKECYLASPRRKLYLLEVH